MNIMMPDWLLLILLLLGAGFFFWLVMLLITFLGLWFIHPRDAHDDIVDNYKERKDK